MDAVKAEVGYKDVQIERMKGVVTDEAKEYKVGYTVMCNSSFVSVKKMPATEVKKEDLTLVVYGNNVTLEQMREFFKLCRTPVNYPLLEARVDGEKKAAAHAGFAQQERRHGPRQGQRPEVPPRRLHVGRLLIHQPGGRKVQRSSQFAAFELISVG